MKLCAVSFKECWQDGAGRWYTCGGFPLQMGAVGSLFDSMTLVIVRGKPGQGGIPLPESARVVALDPPAGADLRRKLSVLARAGYYLPRIAAEIRRADVVHTPLPGDLPLLAFLAGVAMRKRVLARYGSCWATTSQTTLFNRITRGLMRALAGGRNVMLATGEDSSRPSRRMEWVFSTSLTRGELAAIRPDLSRGLSSPPRLIYAGRLSAEKGVAVLLEALSLLARGNAARLTIAGDGPQRNFLESLAARLGVSERVVFAGQLDREALSKAMGEADLCVQPSLTESFCKAWLDAFAHGLPVVASRVGAARGAIGEDGERGWLVRPGDPQDLALALEDSLSTARDWEAMRGRCRRYVEERTLEAWSGRIGSICAESWRVALVEGKLVA